MALAHKKTCPSEDDHLVDVASQILKSIAHPIRLKILCLLRGSEMSVGEIQREVKTSTANISQHLTILRSGKIIESRKEANFIYNRIADPKILRLMDAMQDIFCKKPATF